MSLLNTTDTSSGANVPDAGATTKWKDYIWVRRLGTSGEAKFYIWNENATSDATYLKWQEKSDVVVSDIPMTDGQLLIGGSSNVGTAVALGGDATVNNAGVLTIGEGKITNAKVSSTAAIAYGKLNLGANITNANLAGSIVEGKLAGSIPWSKLTINDAQIPFGKIDKIFEKNINVQAGGTNVTGNYPEYATTTGLAIPEVDGVNGYTGTTKTLEGIYRAIATSGSDAATITIPDPSERASTSPFAKLGTYDGKIFKLSIYREGLVDNEGPLYLRIAGVSPTAGECNVRNVTLTLPAGHGFQANEKVSIMGVYESTPGFRSYEAGNVAAHTIDASATYSIQYTLPTAPVTSITEASGTATVTTTNPHPFKTSDIVHITGAAGGNAGTYNVTHTSITRTSNRTFTMAVTSGAKHADSEIVTFDSLTPTVIGGAWAINQTTTTGVFATNGSGAGATATYTTDAAGNPTFILTAGGLNYAVDEELTFTDAHSSTTNTAKLVVKTLTVSGGGIVVSRANLASWTASGGRGVVVRANKMVDNALGVLSDMVTVIPETTGFISKKVVLDICCDSRSTGDGQWLVSGHVGMRSAHAKSGTKVLTTATSAGIAKGALGPLKINLANDVTAGDKLIDTATGTVLEVTEDATATPGTGVTVTVKNVGEAAVAAGADITLVQPPAPGGSGEYIDGRMRFINPITGELLAEETDVFPKKPGPLGPLDQCWVAREVYGSDDPRWLLFRGWMLNDSPNWFHNLYISKGKAFANWLSRNTWLKPVLRRWMNNRIYAKRN